LGFADEVAGHLGFASTVAAAGAGGDEAGLGAFFDQRGFVLGHQGDMPKTSLPCAVVVSTMPLVSGHRSVNASAALAVCG